MPWVLAAAPNMDKINPCNVPSIPAAPPNRRPFKWFGYVLILLAVIMFRRTLDSLTSILSFVFFLAGLFGVFYTRADRLEDISISPDRGARPGGIAITFYSTRQPRGRRPQLMPPFSQLRAYSYVSIYVLFVPWILFVILTPLAPVGLWVCLPRIGTRSPSRDPGNAPLVLRIDASGHTYLNREPVPVADVYKHLRSQWSLRGDRTVYLDADPEVGAGTVIAAVDEIQGATRANVVLVTPSMKKEAPWLDWTSPCERKGLYSGLLKPAPIWNDRMAYWSPHSTLIQFDIDERGDVSQVEVAKRSTRPARDAALVTWVKKLKFRAIPGCEMEHFTLER